MMFDVHGFSEGVVYEIRMGLMDPQLGVRVQIEIDDHFFLVDDLLSKT